LVQEPRVVQAVAVVQAQVQIAALAVVEHLGKVTLEPRAHMHQRVVVVEKAQRQQ
jgi:hypothetical protein